MTIKVKHTQIFFAVSACAMGFAIVASIVFAALAAPWYLHCAAIHPAAHTKRDPHHWLCWLAAAAAMVFTVHAAQIIEREIRKKASTIAHWRRVFRPLPWERSNSNALSDDHC